MRSSAAAYAPKVLAAIEGYARAPQRERVRRGGGAPRE